MKNNPLYASVRTYHYDGVQRDNALYKLDTAVKAIITNVSAGDSTSICESDIATAYNALAMILSTINHTDSATSIVTRLSHKLEETR